MAGELLQLPDKRCWQVPLFTLPLHTDSMEQDAHTGSGCAPRYLSTEAQACPLVIWQSYQGSTSMHYSLLAPGCPFRDILAQGILRYHCLMPCCPPVPPPGWLQCGAHWDTPIPCLSRLHSASQSCLEQAVHQGDIPTQGRSFKTGTGSYCAYFRETNTESQTNKEMEEHAPNVEQGKTSEE